MASMKDLLASMNNDVVAEAKAKEQAEKEAAARRLQIQKEQAEKEALDRRLHTLLREADAQERGKEVKAQRVSSLAGRVDKELTREEALQQVRRLNGEIKVEFERGEKPRKNAAMEKAAEKASLSKKEGKKVENAAKLAAEREAFIAAVMAAMKEVEQKEAGLSALLSRLKREETELSAITAESEAVAKGYASEKARAGAQAAMKIWGARAQRAAQMEEKGEEISVAVIETKAEILTAKQALKAAEKVLEGLATPKGHWMALSNMESVEADIRLIGPSSPAWEIMCEKAVSAAHIVAITANGEKAETARLVAGYVVKDWQKALVERKLPLTKEQRQAAKKAAAVQASLQTRTESGFVAAPSHDEQLARHAQRELNRAENARIEAEAKARKAKAAAEADRQRAIRKANAEKAAAKAAAKAARKARR